MANKNDQYTPAEQRDAADEERHRTGVEEASDLADDTGEEFEDEDEDSENPDEESDEEEDL